jgi:hypothetical protein
MNANGVGAKTLAYLRGEKDLLMERERLAQVRKRFQDLGLAFWLNNTQKRRVERFWQVVSLLQENSRMSITEMSGKLKTPVSTLFDILKEVEKHFHFTIMLKESEKEVSIRDSTSAEFSYQVSMDNSAKEEPLP